MAKLKYIWTVPSLFCLSSLMALSPLFAHEASWLGLAFGFAAGLVVLFSQESDISLPDRALGYLTAFVMYFEIWGSTVFLEVRGAALADSPVLVMSLLSAMMLAWGLMWRFHAADQQGKDTQPFEWLMLGAMMIVSLIHPILTWVVALIGPLLPIRVRSTVFLAMTYVVLHSTLRL